ncbi:MAG: translation initiation factor IF-2 N-terminal domain-containing protein, partial [Bacteroides sp.]|nr:translation initiation factor IF-2 N-terminal domain-containing protein [Bacteroides sp.]
MTIRLNKVTRDLNVGIATVVEFLQKKGYTVEANPNTKISEEQYAILVKEFSTDKNLRLESERFIQERQNKERNKASVSIEGFEKQPEKQKSEDVIKTVVPEDARPKFKPVGKIDLDKLNGRKPEKVEKEPEQKQEVPAVERPVVKTEVKKELEKREPEMKKEEVVTPTASVVEPTPVVVEPVVVPEPVVETKPVEVEKVVEEVKKEEPKVAETAPLKAEEHKEEKKVETAQAEVAPVVEKAPEDDGVFKIRQPELGAKINVIGQIDLAALNQSTRPKKKSKEEKRREREEKEKIRQDQKKLMKEAIIKEIRKDDSKLVKNGSKENADAAKKKRNRINKEKVDVNNVATSNFAAPRPNIQGKGGNGNNNGQGGQGNNNRRNNNKDRFKKPVIKQEVSEEDVAKQVKETLARLTTKGKNKAAKYRKEKREMVSNRMQELENQEMADSKVLKLTEFVTANELATMMDVSVNQVIGTCMSIGIMVSIHQRLAAETIKLVAEEFG